MPKKTERKMNEFYFIWYPCSPAAFADHLLDTDTIFEERICGQRVEGLATGFDAGNKRVPPRNTPVYSNQLQGVE